MDVRALWFQEVLPVDGYILCLQGPTNRGTWEERTGKVLEGAVEWKGNGCFPSLLVLDSSSTIAASRLAVGIRSIPTFFKHQQLAVEVSSTIGFLLICTALSSVDNYKQLLHRLRDSSTEVLFCSPESHVLITAGPASPAKLTDGQRLAHRSLLKLRWSLSLIRLLLHCGEKGSGVSMKFHVV